MRRNRISDGPVTQVRGVNASVAQSMRRPHMPSVSWIFSIGLGPSCSGPTANIFSISQSKGALTGLLLCNDPPKLEYVDHIISVIVGPEVITGSTRMKAGTATKMVLNMITTTLMIKLNKTYGNLMVDLKASNDKLWDRGTRIIEHLTDLNYDEALNILKSADGEVKTAVVMEKLNVGVEAARDRLRNHKGSLKDVFIKK